MTQYKFNGKLGLLINKAREGKTDDIKSILDQLTMDSDLTTTRNVDYALSLVETEEGIAVIRKYLFEGSLIQRNYCALFFNRLGDWEPVKKAYKLGLIDEIQAFAR